MHKNKIRNIIGIVVVFIVVSVFGVGYIKLKEAVKRGEARDVVVEQVREAVGREETKTEAAPSQSSTDNSKQTTKTSDWKVYKSNEYGFSFRYPASWDFRSWGEVIAAFSPEEKLKRLERREDDSIEETDDIRIVSRTKTGTHNLKEFSRTAWDGWYSNYAKINNIFVGGGEGVQYSSVGIPVPYIPNIATFLGRNDKVIVITLQEASSPELLEVYNNIITSFQFE